MGSEAGAPPSTATAAVLLASESVPEGSREVRGIDFNCYDDQDVTVAELVDGMATMGFQASAVGDAARIINQMVCPPCRSKPKGGWST
jgi:deoxyhypusine synthase